MGNLLSRGRRKLLNALCNALCRLLPPFLRMVWEPICWVTGRRRLKDLEQVRRILFIALDNPGDVLLTTPCLTALKERFPSATLTVLAGEWGEELLSVHPAVSHTIRYNAPWFAPWVTHLAHSPFRPLVDFLRCIWNLWKERFDLVVETRGEALHILLAYLSGAPYRVGYALWSLVPWVDVESLARFLTRRVPYAWDQWLRWHRVEHNLQVVACLGAVPKDPSLVLPIPHRVQQRTQQFLKRHQLQEGDILIGVHPGASRERKRWPRRHFAQVLDVLIDRWDARVVVIGSPQEQGIADELANLMTHQPILAVGQTTLLEAAALVQQCRLVICNDSAITHIASAVKTPVITLSRSPENFYAPYRTEGIALTRRLPCMNRGSPDSCHCPFSEYKCLQAVTPQEVVETAEEILMKETRAHCY